MIRVLSLAVLFTVAPLCFGDELTEKKKQVIDEMLEITGALKVGELMGAAVSNEMISAMMQQQGQVDPVVIQIVQDEVKQVMQDEFVANGFIQEMSYELYDKYFTTAELEEVVAFYKSPIGQKITSVLPQLTQESMLAGQRHAESLGPLIQQRLLARLKAEGAIPMDPVAAPPPQ